MLSAEEYQVIRQKGTERPFSENYTKFYEQEPTDGVYVCRACNTPLYNADTKFSAGCGWPALYQEISGAVERHTDSTMGMTRTEITCKNCGGHLGHEFLGEGFPTPTNSRHCVNYVSIKYVPANK
jgi:peptide-methionine (R)-S-oxide reductase